MNFQITIELIITIAVVCIQLTFFYFSFRKVQEVRNFFPAEMFDETFIQESQIEDQTVQLLKEASSFGKNFVSVIKSINKYLTKNRGVTDFSIIKSIVERNIESRENSVSANISLPLYIGLMGTFIGVVIGLWNIAFSGGVTDNNINTFIGGVVIAMVASFVGLLLTVINNSYNFKNARATCDERKNNFYNFLQAELLPYLENSLFDALDRLKVNINDFNKKFETNIDLFDSKFSSNIGSLRDSVQTLSGSIGSVVDNTKTQKEFLLELKKLGYNRLAESNIKVFTIIKDTVPTLIEFIDKQRELSGLVEKTFEFVSTIDNVMNRIKSFEESLNKFGENINVKEYLGNEILKRIDNNLSYLDKQYELLKQHEIKSSQSIEDFFVSQYRKIQELTDNIKREVETAFDLKIADNPFQKLVLLEALESHLNIISEKMSFNGEFKKISDDLNSTKSDIQFIKQKLGHIIEESSKKGSHFQMVEILNKTKEAEIEGIDEGEGEDIDTINNNGKKTIKRKSGVFSRLTNIFKRKSGRKT